MPNTKKDEKLIADLLRDWLVALQDTVRPTSFTIYRSEVQKHLLPLLGEIPLSCLSASAGNELSEKLSAKGLSARTVKDVVGKLGQALRWGLENGYQVPILKEITMEPASQELQFLSPQQQRQLEASLQHTQEALAKAVKLALHAGLTVGELCALTWADVDKKASTMAVHRICQRVPGGLAYPESDTRVLPLPEGFISECILSNGFVISPPRGGVPEPRLCQSWLKKHLQEVGLPENITFAAMRNTYIRGLMESGIDFITISQLSGCRDLNFLWKKFGAFYHAVA